MKRKYLIYTTVLVLVIIAVIVSLNYNKKQPVLSNSDLLAKSIAEDEESFKPKNDYSKILNCEYINNMDWTECEDNLLDRASAMREYKQKKIEGLKHPEVNEDDTPFTTAEMATVIKKWRNGFEEARDTSCNANMIYRVGSGIPAELISCKLAYEIDALEALDNTYYNVIMQMISASQGIKDFEPKEADIENIMKTNKTKKDCSFSDNKNCNE